MKTGIILNAAPDEIGKAAAHIKEIGFEGVVSLEPHLEWAKMPAAVRLSPERALFTAACSLAE